MKAAKSRKSVQYPALTGSRSYEVCCDAEKDALQLFKETHKKKNGGFSTPVKKAIVSPPELFTSPESRFYFNVPYMPVICCFLSMFLSS